MPAMTPEQRDHIRATYGDVLKRMEIYDVPDLGEYVCTMQVDGQEELMLSQKGFVLAAKHAPDQLAAQRLVMQALRAASSRGGLLDIPYNLRSNPFVFTKAGIKKEFITTLLPRPTDAS